MIPTAQEVKSGWNAFASQYSEIMEKSNVQIALSLARMADVSSAKNILEIACGSGVLALELLQNLPSGVKYTSLDISEEMVKLANAAKEKVKGKLNDVEHQFMVANGEDLSFIPDESIDVVLAPLCMHLTPDPSKLLQEALRVLKKGGRIAFSVLGDPQKCTFFSIVSNAVKETGAELPQKRSIFYLGAREKMIKLAEDNGIKVDFCWLEYVTQGIQTMEDTKILYNTPSTVKTMELIGEEKKAQAIATIEKTFAEYQKNFTPLQTENVLLVGRKPE
jgi:ubiquinone/menaquinone biosynthesis C-methylase UbiE